MLSFENFVVLMIVDGYDVDLVIEAPLVLYSCCLMNRHMYLV